MSEEEKVVNAEIVKREEQPQEKSPAVREDDLPDARNLMYIASGLAQSKMFPQISDKYQALAVIEYGRELGIKPVIALQTMSVVRGRLCIEAKVLLALLEQRGVNVSIVEKTKEVCKIKFEKPGKDPWIEAFTIEDARRIKDSKGMSLSQKDNWLNYPEEMLFWRCVAKGQRAYDPAAALGLYIEEEIHDAGAFREAKKFDNAQAEKKKKKEEEEKKKEEEEKAKPKEEPAKVEPKEEKPKRKRGRPPKKKAKAKEESPITEPKPEAEKEKPESEKPEEKPLPEEGDPSQMTEEEMVDYCVSQIKEDIKLRSTNEKNFREQYKSLKDFLYHFQIEKQKEGKEYQWVEFNEYNHLSLSLGKAEHLKMLLDKWEWVLSAWATWEKEQKERKKEEEYAPETEWPEDESEEQFEEP